MKSALANYFRWFKESLWATVVFLLGIPTAIAAAVSVVGADTEKNYLVPILLGVFCSVVTGFFVWIISNPKKAVSINSSTGVIKYVQLFSRQSRSLAGIFALISFIASYYLVNASIPKFEYEKEQVRGLLGNAERVREQMQGNEDSFRTYDNFVKVRSAKKNETFFRDHPNYRFASKDTLPSSNEKLLVFANAHVVPDFFYQDSSKKLADLSWITNSERKDEIKRVVGHYAYADTDALQCVSERAALKIGDFDGNRMLNRQICTYWERMLLSNVPERRTYLTIDEADYSTLRQAEQHLRRWLDMPEEKFK